MFLVSFSSSPSPTRREIFFTVEGGTEFLELEVDSIIRIWSVLLVLAKATTVKVAILEASGAYRFSEKIEAKGGVDILRLLDDECGGVVAIKSHCS